MSFTSSTYASIVPSLYTLIVYTTVLWFATVKGSCVWLYVIFPSSSIDNNGTLDVISLSSNFVMNFCNAKSYTAGMMLS